MEDILAASEFKTLWYRRTYKSSLLLLPNFSLSNDMSLVTFHEIISQEIALLVLCN